MKFFNFKSVINALFCLILVFVSYACSENDGEECFVSNEESLASTAKIVSCESIFDMFQTRSIVDSDTLIPSLFQLASVRKNRLVISWEEWGHGQECRGWGLCNFYVNFEHNRDGVDTNSVQHAMSEGGAFRSPLVQDTSGNLKVCVIFGEAIDNNEKHLPFIIDSDICSVARLDENTIVSVTLVQGSYLYDSSLGSYGGYCVNAEMTLLESGN